LRSNSDISLGNIHLKLACLINVYIASSPKPMYPRNGTIF